MQFKMVMKTMTSGLPWEYDFEQVSLGMGKMYATAITRQCAQIPWFMGLSLFRRDRNVDPWEFVGEFTPHQETTVQFKEAPSKAA